ncbi:hypothetical protein [Mesobacillus foraminis]|uniref:hypothetical protein n=1 Tax=Mesobacillus foraminis TaxID=279826 RepID=UPI000EF48DD8|nr:hypothetical protein [Mesobacillus foraminis]
MNIISENPNAGYISFGRTKDYAWDVQIIDTALKSAKIPVFHANVNLQDVFEKMIYLPRENIRKVWIKGEKVHTRGEKLQGVGP